MGEETRNVRGALWSLVSTQNKTLLKTLQHRLITSSDPNLLIVSMQSGTKSFCLVVDLWSSGHSIPLRGLVGCQGAGEHAEPARSRAQDQRSSAGQEQPGAGALQVKTMGRSWLGHCSRVFRLRKDGNRERSWPGRYEVFFYKKKLMEYRLDYLSSAEVHSVKHTATKTDTMSRWRDKQ